MKIMEIHNKHGNSKKNIEIPWLVGWLAGWLAGWLRDSWGWKFYENHRNSMKIMKFHENNGNSIKMIEIP